MTRPAGRLSIWGETSVRSLLSSTLQRNHCGFFRDAELSAVGVKRAIFLVRWHQPAGHAQVDQPKYDQDQEQDHAQPTCFTEIAVLEGAGIDQHTHTHPPTTPPPTLHRDAPPYPCLPA